MFIESFVLPDEYTEEKLIKERMAYNGGMYGYIDNIYPCNIFNKKGLAYLLFDKVTIFYGGNGSGKSTLLNLISNKLELKRMAPFNSSELFSAYTYECNYEMVCDDEGFKHKIPDGSRIITSDDVFDYMLAVRVNNVEIAESIEDGREEYARLKFGETIKFRGLQDYELLRMQVLSRSKSVSRRKFLQKTAGSEAKLNSNGETALEYFNTRIEMDRLYCLDEPENSLSPKHQMELVEMLEKRAHYCGCQFIIATHSPFLLAISGAKIYDLDSYPARIRDWWELENPKLYYDFFMRHKDKFESGIDKLRR